MDPLQAAGLIVAGAAAGAINAVAGGGSLISFPALMAFGIDAKPANVTNTVALWPGYLGGSLGYRRELRGQESRVVGLIAPAVLGALCGSALLLATSADAFETIVPFLILFACALLAMQNWFGRMVAALRPHHDRDGGRLPVSLIATTFGLGVYGAYFGGGLGILTLAILGILLPDDLHKSNALKGVLSLVINAAAVGWFALFGPVEWLPALMVAIGALLGGYFGVDFARRLGPRWLRFGVVAYGVVVASVLLVR